MAADRLLARVREGQMCWNFKRVVREHVLAKAAAHMQQRADQAAAVEDKAGGKKKKGDKEEEAAVAAPPALLFGDKEGLRKYVVQWMQQNGMYTQLKNAVYLANKQKRAHLKRSTSAQPSLGGRRRHLRGLQPALPVLEETLDVVDTARRQWDTRLRYELRSVAAKQQRKLVQLRTYGGPGEGAKPPAMEYPIRFVYTSEDLLETIAGIGAPNSTAAVSRIAEWGLVKTRLRTPPLGDLRVRYAELSPDVRQVGIDDELLDLDWFREEQLTAGRGLVRRGYIPEIKAFLRTGCPQALRPKLWSLALGVQSTQAEFRYFEQLLAQVQKWDLITDDLTRFDVQEAADSDEFFVFEEVLDEMLLALSRDPEVPKRSSLTLNTAVLKAVPASSLNKGRSAAAAASAPGGDGKPAAIEAVPPSHVIPFHRQAIFAAPICFLFQKSEEAYLLFRELYVRFFCRLHIISSQRNTILFLSRLFEDLIQSRAPAANFHCVSYGVFPLSLAFPWLFTAFAGCIPVDQTLLLWDRLVAYDSLDLVAVLAAAIFCFRAKSVLRARSPEELQDVFRETSSLKIIPLLQHFLFSH